MPGEVLGCESGELLVDGSAHVEHWHHDSDRRLRIRLGRSHSAYTIGDARPRLRCPTVPATVVVGAQWGDEGKGKLTDLIAKEMQVVVRYQGGHNAGHTIVVGGETFALQLVPSGILYDHITPVIGNGVVVDPAVLLAELDRLTAKGVDCSRLLSAATPT